jgi:hypothetical protein
MARGHGGHRGHMGHHSHHHHHHGGSAVAVGQVIGVDYIVTPSVWILQCLMEKIV